MSSTSCKDTDKPLHKEVCPKLLPGSLCRPVAPTLVTVKADFSPQKKKNQHKWRKSFNLAHPQTDPKTKVDTGSGNVARCQTVHRLKERSVSTISSTNLQGGARRGREAVRQTHSSTGAKPFATSRFVTHFVISLYFFGNRLICIQGSTDLETFHPYCMLSVSGIT